MHKVQREGKLADYKVACLKLKEKKGNYIGRKERVLFIHKKEQPRAWQEQLRAELAISYFLPGLTGYPPSVLSFLKSLTVMLNYSGYDEESNIHY